MGNPDVIGLSCVSGWPTLHGVVGGCLGRGFLFYIIEDRLTHSEICDAIQVFFLLNSSFIILLRRHMYEVRALVMWVGSFVRFRRLFRLFT
jgi:hypothetical protein